MDKVGQPLKDNRSVLLASHERLIRAAVNVTDSSEAIAGNIITAFSNLSAVLVVMAER